MIRDIVRLSESLSSIGLFDHSKRVSKIASNIKRIKHNIDIDELKEDLKPKWDLMNVFLNKEIGNMKTMDESRLKNLDDEYFKQATKRACQMFSEKGYLNFFLDWLDKPENHSGMELLKEKHNVSTLRAGIRGYIHYPDVCNTVDQSKNKGG